MSADALRQLNHPNVAPLSATTGQSGPTILPAQRVRLYSSDEWEALVEEWAHVLKKDGQYARVLRASGPGDEGRDVVCYVEADRPDPWHNYQCKHYDHPLRPTDIWSELGKLCYYTHVGEYSVPAAYAFVAPQDVGPSVAKLLENPNELKRQLVENWEKSCEKAIRTEPVPLIANLKKHVEGFDFGIVTFKPVLELLTEHRDCPWHVARFGGALPGRPLPAPPPKDVDQQVEAVYVRQLRDAYKDAEGGEVDPNNPATPPIYREHFCRSRVEFYCAESLRNFSRDAVPDGTFEGLQDEVFDGVLHVCTQTHANGFDRVQRTVAHATTLPLHSSPLSPVTGSKDKCGICHQLANDERLKWIQPNGSAANQT